MIPEEAIVAGAKAMDAYWGGRYAPDEVEELRGEVTAILEAVSPILTRKHQAALARVEIACDAMDAGTSIRSGDPRTKSFAAQAIRAVIREELEGK